ncbi:MAG TPA: hypothetical protein VJQ25_04545, partial [Nitrospira sp.]|nr:hypothetical protein [Nitrospira sp.]
TQHGVTFSAYVIHHGIARPKGVELSRAWAINTLCYQFDTYLAASNEPGTVNIDIFDERSLYAIMIEKFSRGLVDFKDKPDYRLRNIVSVNAAKLGASHFGSIIDILIGSLRFAVNNREVAEQAKTCDDLLTQLAPLFHRRPGATEVSALGLSYRPKDILSSDYFDETLKLHKYLSQRGICAEDLPTFQGRYFAATG